MAMQIELRCPCCPCRFRAPSFAPAAEVLDRMTEEGPWFALAEGDTFQDMLEAALRARGRIRCPECGTAVAVGDELASEPLPC
jgi:hypothetical protein